MGEDHAIYLLEFELPHLPVIKLGFSSNPEFRMRQVQIDPSITKGSVLRSIPAETGHRAICLEKALHSHIKTHRPDLIVPPELFRTHIGTTSEIYHRHGRSYISALLDAVVAGWDPSTPAQAA
ncbi:GIY-YIG nuclease family protein [uncultured Tateyamaria sp.]|uniref:GIY-YIG nuclease family protein n=1 Tax=uncultured Tateyamaria sp. TaxID=455651 RepID=UPI002627F86F|nr:GIY-YIG nuclease family protein [uncultured Tateyamaria sp.]